jgi:large subunit ribosomal protein L25
MNKKILKAEERKINGRKVKTLRAQGILPGNVYGKKVKSEAVQVSLKEFELLYKEVGETGLVDLEVGKDVKPVLVHSLQVNPKTNQLIHVDFLQVDLKVKVTAEVPVELTGESPATKQGIGTVVQQLNNVEVEALPTDLPEKFEVNVEILTEVDQAIYVKDLKVDSSKVELKTDPEAIVVKVEPPQKEEVVETPIVPVGAEGAVPAEGEATEGQPASDTSEKPEKPE